MSMAAPGDQPPPAWRVTGQVEYTQVGQTGPPVPGVKVFYITGQGHSGSVFVPQDVYNAAHVRDAVAAAAARMDAIGSLTG